MHTDTYFHTQRMLIRIHRHTFPAPILVLHSIHERLAKLLVTAFQRQYLTPTFFLWTGPRGRAAELPTRPPLSAPGSAPTAPSSAPRNSHPRDGREALDPASLREPKPQDMDGAGGGELSSGPACVQGPRPGNRVYGLGSCGHGGDAALGRDGGWKGALSGGLTPPLPGGGPRRVPFRVLLSAEAETAALSAALGGPHPHPRHFRARPARTCSARTSGEEAPRRRPSGSAEGAVATKYRAGSGGGGRRGRTGRRRLHAPEGGGGKRKQRPSDDPNLGQTRGCGPPATHAGSLAPRRDRAFQTRARGHRVGAEAPVGTQGSRFRRGRH